MALLNLRVRWIYFWLFAWYASQGRFTSIFLLDRGISEEQIGIMFAVTTLLAIPASASFANLGDMLVYNNYKNGREVVLAALTVLTTITYLLQMVPEMNGYTTEASFQFIFCTRILFNIFRAPTMTIVDAIAVLQVERSAESSGISYGTERLFGAVSWAIVSVILGVLIDSYSTFTMYILCAITLVPLLGSILEKFITAGTPNYAKLPSAAHTKPSTTEENEETSPLRTTSSPLKALPLLLFNYFSTLPNVMFILCVLVLSMGMSIVENLLFVFFTQTLHANNFLCGLSVAVTVVFEIPIFYYGKYLLARFGVVGLMTIAMVTYATRVIGYTLVPNGWYVLLLEPLHGVTYGCSAIASVEFASSVCPPGLEATSQTLIGICRYGVGYVIGTGLAGYIEQHFGSDVLYRGAGCIVFVVLLAYRLLLFATTLQRTVVGDQQQPEPLATEDDEEVIVFS